MSLGRKVSLVILAAGLAYLLVVGLLASLVVLPRFDDLEHLEAADDLSRGVEAIGREVHHLDRICRDWSAWDDTYQFLADRNDHFRSANLHPGTFVSAGLHLVLLADLEGRVVFRGTFDPEDGETLDLPVLQADRLPAEHPLASPLAPGAAPNEGATAVLEANGVPLIAVARSVVRTDRRGPIRGLLIMGRLLDETAVERLREQTRVELTVLLPGGDLPLAEGDASAWRRIAEGAADVIRDDGGGRLRAWAPVLDAAGRPVLLVRAEIPREISARGLQTTVFSIVAVVLAAVVLGLAVAVFVRRAVLHPVARITAGVAAAAGGESSPAALRTDRTDEFGTLARRFRDTFAALADARHRLEAESFRAGMAELAEGLLHDVRNRITPIVVELDLLGERLAAVPVDRIEACHGELGEAGLPAERRRDLEGFFDLACRSTIETLRDVGTRVRRLAASVQALERSVARAEPFAGAERPAEPFALGGALVEAFAALPEADRGAVRLAVDDRARDVRLCAFRAVTVRVLAEILANAAEAIRRGGRADGRITVEAGPASERDAPAGTTRAPGAAPSPAGAGPRFVSVRVADDGEGLSAEARDRLFEPGFTTRPRPGPGPGLHWCANAIALMGGSIRAESEGPGRGATVVIVLPAGNGAAEGG